MDFIIFYDENYTQQTKSEIGDFEVLDAGVGKIDENSRDNCCFMHEYIDFDRGILQKRLKYSVFVRHFFEVTRVLNDLSEFDIEAYQISQDDKIAFHISYANHTTNATQSLIKEAEAKNYSCDIKNPDIIISLLVTKERVFVGVQPRDELATNYKKGEPHYHKRNEISRAEFKLQEAIEYYKIDLQRIKTALDLGASPGGWTHYLATQNISVTAVDPAMLDEKVLDMPNVTHCQQLSQKFLQNCEQKFDMLVNDMKMFGDKSAHIVCNCKPILNSQAMLVMTIKLAEFDIFKQIKNALNILTEEFEIIGVKKLFHNRQEVTVVAKRLNSVKK